MAAAVHTTRRPTSDEQVIAGLRYGKSSEKWRSLFEAGDTSGYGNDASRADSALAALLARATNDHQQIARIMRQSALVREKWDRMDYLDRTIAGVLLVVQPANPGATRQPPGPQRGGPAAAPSASPGQGDDELQALRERVANLQRDKERLTASNGRLLTELALLRHRDLQTRIILEHPQMEPTDKVVALNVYHEIGFPGEATRPMKGITLGALAGKCNIGERRMSQGFQWLKEQRLLAREDHYERDCNNNVICHRVSAQACDQPLQFDQPLRLDEHPVKVETAKRYARCRICGSGAVSCVHRCDDCGCIQEVDVELVGGELGALTVGADSAAQDLGTESAVYTHSVVADSAPQGVPADSAPTVAPTCEPIPPTVAQVAVSAGHGVFIPSMAIPAGANIAQPYRFPVCAACGKMAFTTWNPQGGDPLPLYCAHCGVDVACTVV